MSKHQHVRVNIQLSPSLKAAVQSLADAHGESVSTFFRRSAEERMERLRKQQRTQKMKAGYQALAQESPQAAIGWEHVDLEGWVE